MANRSFANVGRIFAPHTMPVLIDCNFEIGAAGAVVSGSLKGPMVSSVAKVATGIYQVRFQDNYNKFFGMKAIVKAPVTGANVALASITPGVVYEITALGNSTAAQWLTAGLPAGVDAAVGAAFVAAATSGGTGQVKAIGVSGIEAVEVIGNPSLALYPIGIGNIGGYVLFQCLGSTAVGDTTMVATNPASGSKLYLDFYLSNSNVTVQGE